MYDEDRQRIVTTTLDMVQSLEQAIADAGGGYTTPHSASNECGYIN